MVCVFVFNPFLTISTRRGHSRKQDVSVRVRFASEMFNIGEHISGRHDKIV
jgi:hypothetical protein